ncbi:hypothetical protein LIER_39636 [Lithospermum erythrorhizon]|uniref:DUF4283 domain-containing protein n=1 Tax=Lithospermum erythrorhizon TaxID=34254 RepID=A0AAV3QHW1_LITER
MADREPTKPSPRLEESVKQPQISSQILYSEVVKAQLSQPYTQQLVELNTNDALQIFDAKSSSLKETSLYQDDISQNILEKFWVKVFYDEVPLFCSFCCHIGHGTGTCKRRWEDSRSGKTSVQGKAELTSADQVFDNLPQSDNSTNSTKFTAGNCGSKMGRQTRPSKEWQPIGKHVPNARSAMGNKVSPESSAQISLMQNTGNEVKSLILENSFKELASLDNVQSIKDAAGNLEYKEGSGSSLIPVLEQNA